ncbi:class I SAM-dependent methyltransferase [Catalinimonas niigatensis]|uniref:class I SAM-dependent methyltransferase n=1 Tax=Catalinimonas niigatensis TaxID=1397264 RepID=UPI00266588D4|nr:class I SAM-dependent methyltransferase [Catalinimonas niigatensis]WPP49981.1 class I SAM-dependent methyltransferase [Catalinimonas niigatensis]
MCKVCSLDNSWAEAFGQQMLDVINHGALALMLSLGHRTGLFDAMSELPPADSQTLADAAGLNERYVREWLGAMVSGRIVTVQRDETTVPEKVLYHLPNEHAAALTRTAGSDNIGVFAQYIPLLGYVEDEIVQCFRQGGGVSYDQYNRFHEVMVEDSGLAVVSSLLVDVLPLVPDMLDRLKEGIHVLDVGCGSGKALNLLAEHFPNSCFMGYDLCAEPLVAAHQEAMMMGLDNVHFVQQDLTDFDITTQFDFITAFDAIHDQARPDKVLKGIYNSLKEDGKFLMVDVNASSRVEENIDHPLGTLLYTVSTMHCMSVSLAQGGMGLGAMWGREKAVEMLKEAGFSKIKEHILEQDIQNRYFIISK